MSIRSTKVSTQANLKPSLPLRLAFGAEPHFRLCQPTPHCFIPYPLPHSHQLQVRSAYFIQVFNSIAHSTEFESHLDKNNFCLGSNCRYGFNAGSLPGLDNVHSLRALLCPFSPPARLPARPPLPPPDWPHPEVQHPCAQAACRPSSWGDVGTVLP